MSYLLAVMSKSPELGRVKTRMQPYLSKAQSRCLHIHLTQYVLNQWLAIDGLTTEVWVGGDIANFTRTIVSSLRKNNRVLAKDEYPSIHAQPSGDLGQRMAFAIKSSLLAGIEGVLVVGTDCPFIDKTYLQQAKDYLQDYDVVIGPARDGGYVLIGMKSLYSALFEGVQWGTSSVLETTFEIINRQQLSAICLPTLSDIDTPNDLSSLKGELANIYHRVMEVTR